MIIGEIAHKALRDKLRIGVLSDTHGNLDTAVMKALQGVDLILHAGDIDTPEVLEALEGAAPVKAVRGNMDRGRWARRLPAADAVEAAGHLIYLLHDLQQLDLDPAAAGFAAVVCGHTHRPAIHRRDGVLFLNPGSATHPRWGSDPSVAVLDCSTAGTRARIVCIKPQHRSLI